MGFLFRKVSTRPLPRNAVVSESKDGTLTAKWTPRGAKKPVTSEVVRSSAGRLTVKQESGVFYARYRNENGVLVEESTGCRDRTNAEHSLAIIERKVERIRSGVVSAKESSAGENASVPISDHICDYVSTLSGADHRGDTERCLNRLAADLKWRYLTDLRRDAIELWIAAERSGGRSARSTESFRVAACSFAGWCERSGRILENPFARLPRQNIAADPRKPRRALRPEELLRLLEAARNAPHRPKAKKVGRPEEKLPGPARADLYAFMAGTGLRLREVRKLVVADLDLGDTPHLRLPASLTKGRRKGVIPLREDLAELLRKRHVGSTGNTPVFPVPADLIKRFHADCRRAGIPRYDSRGRQADLHGLRLTFGTYLAVAGVPLVVTQKLMRHTDPKLTANLYTDEALLDLSGAVERLPSVVLPPGDKGGDSRSG